MMKPFSHLHCCASCLRGSALALSLVWLLSACGGGSDGAPGTSGAPGSSGTTALVRTVIEPASANCATGGVRIDSGLDANANGVLEDAEASATAFACNGTAGGAGTAGLNSLVRTSPEPVGANCAAGGLRVQTGLDTSRDGVLQPGEVTSTDYVCSVAAAGLKSWRVAQLIETDNAGDAETPQIAFDASGNALAVWSQSDGTRFDIWANRFTPTGGWGTAALIETDNAGDAFEPQIAFDANGNALAVWYQSDGTLSNIWANRFTPTGGWGTATLIETDNAGNTESPQIAIDASGNALAVWGQSDGTRFNIYANRFTIAGGWGTAALIETDNAGDAFVPQIAIDTAGNAIAVWYQSDGTRDNIWANRYTPAGGWGTAALIETDNAGGARNPQIAIDANGNALAVWFQSDGTRFNIWANRFTPTGGWGTAALIETDNAGDAFDPQIAFDANGNALAVWEQADATNFNIWANRFTPAGGWGTATLIETDNANNALAPEIAFDANGNALAVWRQSDNTRTNIWANSFTPAGGWGAAALIETDNAGNAFNAQIAFDRNGNAIAVWQQSDGTRTNIVASSFR